MRALVDAGVTVNIVSDYSDELSERAIGMNFDGSLIFTNNQAQQRAEFPRRPLARLAHATHGAIFNLNQITLQQPFTRAFSQVIDQQVEFQLPMARECRCVLPNAFDPEFITDRCQLVRA